MPKDRHRNLAYDKIMLEHIIMSTINFSPLDKHLIINIIPELKLMMGYVQNHPAHVYDVFGHTIKVVEGIDCDLILKLVALLHDCGKPYTKTVGADGYDHFRGHEIKGAEIAKNALTKLGYNESIIEKICLLIKYHDLPTKPTVQSIYETAALIGKENLNYLFTFQIADMKGHELNYGYRKIKVLNKVLDLYRLLRM